MSNQFFAERSISHSKIALHLLTKAAEGTRGAATITFHTTKDGEYIEPMYLLSADEAQQIVDELWRCGVRPSEGTGSAGSLAATERHLSDMQRIAFTLLEPVPCETKRA